MPARSYEDRIEGILDGAQRDALSIADEMQAEIDGQETAIDGLSREIDDLRSELSQANDELSELQKKIEEESNARDASNQE